jgi:hypothetical protein
MGSEIQAQGINRYAFSAGTFIEGVEDQAFVPKDPIHYASMKASLGDTTEVQQIGQLSLTVARARSQSMSGLSAGTAVNSHFLAWAPIC